MPIKRLFVKCSTTQHKLSSSFYCSRRLTEKKLDQFSMGSFLFIIYKLNIFNMRLMQLKIQDTYTFIVVTPGWNLMINTPFLSAYKHCLLTFVKSLLEIHIKMTVLYFLESLFLPHNSNQYLPTSKLLVFPAILYDFLKIDVDIYVTFASYFIILDVFHRFYGIKLIWSSWYSLTSPHLSLASFPHRLLVHP